MNKKLTSLSAIRSLTTLIVFLATAYAYLVPLANVLRYHEQHHLFRFTADYFRQTLSEEGLLYYATNFVVQFFFHPWLGAMVMATLLTLIFVGVEGMLKRLLFGRALPLCLGLVPVLWLLFYTETTAHDLCWVVLSAVLIGGAGYWWRCSRDSPRGYPCSVFKSLGQRRRKSSVCCSRG